MRTVQLSEYVGHSGRFRVAFDPDGADVVDFNQHILADIADPAGNVGNAGHGNLWEINARLPNMDCNNCTLQVVQVMNGDTQDPVADTVGQSSYYQCADLQLMKDPSQPDGYSPPFIGPGLAPDSTDTVVDMPAPGSGTPGTDSPAVTGNMPGTSPGTSAAAGSDRSGMSEGDAGSEGGCSFARSQRSGSQRSGAWQALDVAAAASLAALRRRRRARCEDRCAPGRAR